MKVSVSLCFEESDSLAEAAEVTFASGEKVTLTHALSAVVVALPVTVIDVQNADADQQQQQEA